MSSNGKEKQMPFTRIKNQPRPFIRCGGIVLAPFMGSGSTLRAAKDFGLRATGIEIEEKYCQAAIQRMAQGVLFPLPLASPAKLPDTEPLLELTGET